MACSDCYPGNTTVLQAGANVAVAGSGTVSDPFVISANEVESGDRTGAVNVEANPDLNLFNLTGPTTVRVTLNADANISLPNWGINTAGSIILVITQGTGGSREIAFAAAGVRSTAPIALSNAVGAIDVVRLIWTGLNWIATDVVLNVV